MGLSVISDVGAINININDLLKMHGPADTDATPTVSAGRVMAILSTLISYYGLDIAASRINSLFNLINQESLRSFDPRRDHLYSAINGNGFPVQFSVSLGATTRSLRCLGEIGAPGMSMPARLRLSTIRLREILTFLDRRSAIPVINQLLEILFPKDPAAVMQWTGGIWMAFGAARDHPFTLRLYLNQRWGNIPERFVRIGRVFATLGRSHSLDAWKQIAGTVSAGAVPYGVAFDIVPGGIGCFKVYLACESADRKYLETLLRCLGLGHTLDQVMLWFEQCALGRKDLPPWCILPSLEFSAVQGDPVGIKLDVSCHHLQTSDAEMDKRIRICVDELSLDPEEYATAIQAMSSRSLSADKVQRIQYCGIGFQGSGRTRLNIYLCPDVMDMI